MHEIGEDGSKQFGLFDLAVPNHQHLPSGIAECRLRLSVALKIAVEFLVPKLSIGSRSSAAWAIVAVPKTAMYEDDLLMAW